MTPADAKKTICGPLIPVITNYADDLSVDHDAIRENVNYVVDRGVRTGSGVLLAAGAGGDFPMLTLDERKAVSETIVRAAAGRTPVVIGAQDTNPAVSVELARFAEDIGAWGIQLAPGYYYESSPEDCYRLFETVHEATSTLGIMIYNTHWEAYDMSLDDVERLAELPRCLALKWSTARGTLDYQRGVVRFRDRLAVIDNHGLQGLTHLLGGRGYITHLCTVWPEHDLEVFRLLEAGEYAAAQELLSTVNWPWYDFRVRMWRRTGAESPVVNAALELTGRRGGPSRLPTRRLDESERAELRRILTDIGVPGVQANS